MKRNVPTICIAHLHWDPYHIVSEVQKHNRRSLNYIDAISAKDMARAIEPMLAITDPYNKAAGPPFSHETWKLSARASHAACSVIMKLLIASVLM
jgi:hypothetical protein